MSKPFAFFGTPTVARDTLAMLLAHGYRPEVVVTSPDAHQGRGMTLAACPTKELALSEGIPVLTPDKLNEEARAQIATYGCAYGIVVAYGKILPQTLIEQFPQGLINVHYSLLPAYRGASPVESALLNGETVSGVSIQKLVRKLDAGDVLIMREEAIQPDDTARSLRPRLITLGANLLIELLPTFEDGDVVATPQDESLATHCGKFSKEDGELNLADDARANWNRFRALIDSPGTYFFVERNSKRIRVKIKEAHLDGITFIPERVVPEGKKEMSYSDFIR